MGCRGRPWKQPVREGKTEWQRSGAPDWSQLEPYEEGRAGDLPTDDRVLFGDFAHQLLGDMERGAPPHASQQLRLRGAGNQGPFNPPDEVNNPGVSEARQGGPPRFIGRSRSSSGASSLQEGHMSVPGAAPDAGEGGAEEAGPSEGGQGETSAGSGVKKVGKKRGKKKLPVPDLDSIKDPSERRRQRRLVKNRNTAAASRERKQREFDDLTARTEFLAEDNTSLQRQLASRDAEIARLQREISGIARGSAAAVTSAGVPSAGGGQGSGSSGGPHSGRPPSGSPGGQPLRRQRGGQSISSGVAAQWPQPMPPAGAIGVDSSPGFIRGVDGQFLRLRPGVLLPGAAAAAAGPGELGLPRAMSDADFQEALHGPSLEERPGQPRWHDSPADRQ